MTSFRLAVSPLITVTIFTDRIVVVVVVVFGPVGAVAGAAAAVTGAIKMFSRLGGDAFFFGCSPLLCLLFFRHFLLFLLFFRRSSLLFLFFLRRSPLLFLLFFCPFIICSFSIRFSLFFRSFLGRAGLFGFDFR